MSVLESMRSGSDSTGMQFLMGLVVLSFIGWFAMPQGDRSAVVAVVNGKKILSTDHTRAYRQNLYQAEARYGRALTNDQQEAISEQTRQQLIEEAVVMQEAERLGIEVSYAEVLASYAESPSFQDENGIYDPNLMERYLKRNQMNIADFDERQRQALVRAKLQMLVIQGASLSDAELRQAFTESRTRVELRYVPVRASSFTDAVQPTDEEIEAFLVESDPEITARYDRDYQKLYNLPEQVDLRLIRLPLSDETPLEVQLPKANDLHAQLVAGADFGELAQANSVDPTAESGGALGLRKVSTLGSEDATAIEAVDGLGLARVVVTQNDLRIYEVVGREAPKVLAKEDVARDIAITLLQEQQAPVLAARFAEEELLPKWKELGESPTELLTAKGLTHIDSGAVPIRQQGLSFGGPPQDALDAARSGEVGAVFDEIFTDAAGTLFVAQLISRTEPDEATFEAEAESMRETALMEKREVFFRGWVDAIKAEASIR